MPNCRYDYLEEQQYKQQALRNGGIEEYGYSKNEFGAKVSRVKENVTLHNEGKTDRQCKIQVF